jgi:hypothetical protein
MDAVKIMLGIFPFAALLGGTIEAYKDHLILSWWAPAVALPGPRARSRSRSSFARESVASR